MLAFVLQALILCVTSVWIVILVRKHLNPMLTDLVENYLSDVQIKQQALTELRGKIDKQGSESVDLESRLSRVSKAVQVWRLGVSQERDSIARSLDECRQRYVAQLNKQVFFKNKAFLMMELRKELLASELPTSLDFEQQKFHKFFVHNFGRSE